jgi:hypothetical protein
MPPYTSTLDKATKANFSEPGLSAETVKHWISELTDFTPQQVDKVVAERYKNPQS